MGEIEKISVVDPDPYSGAWLIRIRIHNMDPDPNSIENLNIWRSLCKTFITGISIYIFLIMLYSDYTDMNYFRFTNTEYLFFCMCVNYHFTLPYTTYTSSIGKNIYIPIYIYKYFNSWNLLTTSFYLLSQELKTRLLSINQFRYDKSVFNLWPTGGAGGGVGMIQKLFSSVVEGPLVLGDKIVHDLLHGVVGDQQVLE